MFLRRRPGVVIGAIVVAILLALVIAQLVLPGIAARQLRDRLSRSGTVEQVEVDAFPAIELLWHHADKVVVRMGTYQSDPATLSRTLSGIADASSLDASANQLDTGLLTLRDVRLTKRGSEIAASATIAEADLRSALPVLDSVVPVGSSGGQVTLQGTATVLGVSTTIDVLVRPQDGALVATPGVPLGSFATVTLFSNPLIAVQGMAAASAPGGFELSALARLR